MNAASRRLNREHKKIWEKCCDAIDECSASVVTRERNCELLKLLYALYSVKYGLSRDAVPPTADPALGSRLRQAIAGMEEPGYPFGDIAPLCSFLETVPGEAYAAVYPLIGYSKKEVAFGVGFSDGELVSSDGEFHRVSQRRHLADVDLDALCDAHVHDTALDGSLSVEFHHPDRLSDLNFSQSLHPVYSPFIALRP